MDGCKRSSTLGESLKLVLVACVTPRLFSTTLAKHRYLVWKNYRIKTLKHENWLILDLYHTIYLWVRIFLSIIPLAPSGRPKHIYFFVNQTQGTSWSSHSTLHPDMDTIYFNKYRLIHLPSQLNNGVRIAQNIQHQLPCSPQLLLIHAFCGKCIACPLHQLVNKRGALVDTAWW